MLKKDLNNIIQSLNNFSIKYDDRQNRNSTPRNDMIQRQNNSQRQIQNYNQNQNQSHSQIKNPNHDHKKNNQLINKQKNNNNYPRKNNSQNIYLTQNNIVYNEIHNHINTHIQSWKIYKIILYNDCPNKYFIIKHDYNEDFKQLMKDYNGYWSEEHNGYIFHSKLQDIIVEHLRVKFNNWVMVDNRDTTLYL